MTILTQSHGNKLNGNANGFTLRPRQVMAIDRTVDSLRSGKRRPIIQLPCGGGKTVIASEIFNRALRKGKKAMFVVPSISLIDQTHAKFSQAGIYDVGIIQAQHPLTNPDAKIQIASVDTLRRRTIPMVDLVIPDECHLKPKFYWEWINRPGWEKVPFVGLSATPWTQGLGKIFDDLIVAATMQEMLNEKLSCPLRIYNPEGPKPDLSQIDLVKNKDTGEEDFHEGQLSEVMSDPKLIGHVVQNWLEKGQNRKTLVFCVNKRHARNLQAQFEKDGVSTAYIDDGTKREERTIIGQNLERGDIQVVVQIATCVYGVDWPFLDCIVWSTPTLSEIKLVQGVGRCLRLDPSNPSKESIMFDHSLTTTKDRLGHPLDIHHETLCDGRPKSEARSRKQKKKPAPQQSNTCPCGFVRRLNQPRCPDCGYVYVPPTDVEYAPGNLYEVQHQGVAKAKADMNTKQLWYSQLLWMQDQRGYEDGWSANQYRKKFEVWPRGLRPIRTPPGKEVLNWVKAGIIRWVHSRRNKERRTAA